MSARKASKLFLQLRGGTGLESDAMDGAPPVRGPWLLIASALVLLIMLVYVLLGAYLHSRQRLADLETELMGVYQEEAEVQTQLAQALSGTAVLQQEIVALTAERDALVRLERDLDHVLRQRTARRD